MSTQRIEINIEELVLEGFDVMDQHKLGMALQNELQRLFIEQGIPESIKNNIKLGDLSPTGIDEIYSANPEAIGVQTASRIYNGFHDVVEQNNPSKIKD